MTVGRPGIGEGFTLRAMPAREADLWGRVRSGLPRPESRRLLESEKHNLQRTHSSRLLEGREDGAHQLGTHSLGARKARRRPRPLPLEAPYHRDLRGRQICSPPCSRSAASNAASRSR